MIETVLDRYPTPECAQLLGLDILAAAPERRWVRIAFEGRDSFCNAAGFIQGGFLAAMLDDAMGPAVLITTAATLYPSTINMNVSFLAPAKPGTIMAEATVVQLGKTIGFVEACLFSADNVPIARSMASVRLSAMSKVFA
jgi:uncharacterized protein (TIGR00369 family)